MAGIRIKTNLDYKGRVSGFNDVIYKIETLKMNLSRTDRFDKRFKLLLKKTLDDTRQFIDGSRKRPAEQHTDRDETDRLTKKYNLFNVIKEGSEIVRGLNDVRLSIGKKSFLDKHAPYWFVVNYGGPVPNAGKWVPGYFDDGEYPKGMVSKPGVFHYMARKKGTNVYAKNKMSFFMTPMRPIPPMLYIQHMKMKFEEQMSILLKDIRKEIKELKK